MSDLSTVLSRIQQIQATITAGTGGRTSSPPAAAKTASAPSGSDFAGYLTAARGGATSAAGSVATLGSAMMGIPGTAVNAAGTGSLSSYAPVGQVGAGYGGASYSGSSSGSQVVADAERYLGVPYVWGGTTPQGFDCSGLVQHVYADLGIALPRTSEQQAQSGRPVAGLADAQPGDLLFFAGSDGTTGSPGHVGIYIGNGQMIDAPYTGTDVRIESAGTPVAIRRIVGQAGTGTDPVPTSFQPVGAAGGYSSAFAAAGAASGVPATLLASVARVESGLDPSAVSPAGAEGLMQLMPSTAASLGVDPWNPAQAITGAARLLSAAYHQFGSWPLAVAAYNAGSGAVESYGGIPPYPETEAYVTKVLSGAGMAS